MNCKKTPFCSFPSIKFTLFLLPLFFVFIFLHLSGFWTEPPLSRKVLVPPPRYIEHFHLGYNESVGDFLWLRLLQDFAACGQTKVSKSSLKNLLLSPSSKSLSSLSSSSLSHEHEHEIDGKQNKVLRQLAHDFFKQDSKICFKGWTYQMLDAISKLAPQFHLVYTAGATSLSVIGNDPIGAKLIFDRGIEVFPRRWKILYPAAYHYLYELLNIRKAADLLKQAQKHGAPYWLGSLASRLYTQLGQLNIALTLLLNYEKTLTDEKLKKKVRKRIHSLLEQKKKKKESQRREKERKRKEKKSSEAF